MAQNAQSGIRENAAIRRAARYLKLANDFSICSAFSYSLAVAGTNLVTPSSNSSLDASGSASSLSSASRTLLLTSSGTSGAALRHWPANRREVFTGVRFGYGSLSQVGIIAASASPANTRSTASRHEVAVEMMSGCSTGFG